MYAIRSYYDNVGLNSKRGQLSIEMVILILATLLGGALLSAELTKNSGSHEEISDVKKKVFAGVITTNIENNAVKGTYATFETGYTVTDEADDTANDEEFEGIAIVPGNGDNVEFLIIRITSYNVCYTKLLRLHRKHSMQL